MEIHPVPRPPADEEPVLPKGPIAIVAGAQGLFKVVRNPFYSACVKLDGLPTLADLEESAELHVPVLPLEVFRRVEGFFVQVYEEHHSEAVVLLYCNPALRRWHVVVPLQEVLGLHVAYDLKTLPDAPPGFELFGTIHSHANITAFHSSTDDTDEAHFDGLHITVGDVDKAERSYACRWILAGKVFAAELAEVVELPPLPEPDSAWLQQVRKQEPHAPIGWPRWREPAAGLDRPDLDLGLFDDTPSDHEGYLEHLTMLRDEIDARLWEAEEAAMQGETPCSEEANT